MITIDIDKETLRIAVALSKPLDYLELSTRSYNCLRRWGIDTIADLCAAYLKGELPKIRNMGQKSIYEIECFLKRYITEAQETAADKETL